MKLFLSSTLEETMPLFTKAMGTKPKKTRVLFIANAADPYKEKYWIDFDRQAWIRAGYQLIEIDLRNTTDDSLINILDNSDVIHMCGGNTFYLLSLLQDKGFVDIIADFVRKNKIIYSGTSAGSILASSMMELYKYTDEGKQFTKKLTGFKGLGLVDFIIVPHCNNEKFIKTEVPKIISHLPEQKLPLIFLYDNQAVIVREKKFEIASI